MSTGMQSRSVTRGARHQSLFYRDLSASPATRSIVLKGEPGTPGQAAAASALWRENFGGSEPPPPPMYTLDDCIDRSPDATSGEVSFRSPDSKFDEAKSPFRTPLSGMSNRMAFGGTPGDTGQAYLFGSPSLQNSQPIKSTGSPNWWSPLKERKGLDLVIGRDMRDMEREGGSPVSGVVQQPQQSGGLLTLPTLREIVRPEVPWSGIGPDKGAEGEEWVTVFGFGPDETNVVMRELEKCGTIVRHVPGPGGANWIHIQFENQQGAYKALQKNGMQINGALIVGVKPLDPLQRRALTERSQRTGFMVLPPKTPGRGTPSGSVKAAARPYYLQPTEVGPHATGPIASPAKSTISKIMDLVFGL